MRRLVLLALVLAVVALGLWRLEGGAWPGSGGDDVTHREKGADEAADALLRGRAPQEGTEAPETVEPVAPPSWSCGTITGRVVAPDGTPAPGAKASAVGVVSLYGDAHPYRSDPGDARGRFALHAEAGLATIVTVTAPGFCITAGPRVLLGEGESRDVGTLRLVLEKQIAVRVVDEAGAPVEDVDVSLEAEADPLPEGWMATLETSGVLAAESTNAEGRTLFDKLPAGSYRVCLDTGDTATCAQVREHVEAGGDEVLFVVPVRVVPESFGLILKILGPNGLPVPLVRATLRAAGAYLSTWIAAGSDDPLELEAAQGPVRLVVWSAQDENRVPLGFGPVVIPDARRLESPAVVRMEPGSTITGRVLWEGEPTTWTVRATGWLDPERGVCAPGDESEEGWARLQFQARADAAGVFCVVGLPPGRFALRAMGIGRMPEPWPIVPAGATDIVLHTVREGRMQVRVLAPMGLTFGNASLSLLEWVDGGIQPRSSWSGGVGDSPGERTIQATGLRLDGRYRLRVWGRCSGVSCPVVTVDDVVPREEPYVVQLENGPHVRGVVERADGTPVWGAQVHYRPWPGGELDPYIVVDGRWLGFSATDAAGAFDLSGLGDEDVVLAVTGQGLTLRDAPPQVRPGSSGIHLVVVPERRISGRLSDPAGGSLDVLRVAAVPEHGRPALWTPRGVTADGFFEVRGLSPGTYRIAAWNEWEATDTRSVLSDPLSAGRHDVRLELRPGPVLQGVVRDAAKRPISGASVRLLGRWTNRADRTDHGGRYAFRGIAPDVDYEVEVVTPEGRRITRSYRPTGPARTTTLDMALPAR